MEKRSRTKRARLRERESETIVGKKTTRNLSFVSVLSPSSLWRSERDVFFFVMGRIKARALSRARMKQQRDITHLDVRALQSDHGHGRATDVTGADAANLNHKREREVWVSIKKPRCALPTKTKLRDRSRENGKRREISSDARTTTTRREENDVREKARIRSVLLVILTIIIMFFSVCVCVCVRACLKDEEENSQRATFERWRERERCGGEREVS